MNKAALNHLTGPVVFCLISLFVMLAPPANAQQEETVHGLLRSGWVITQKTETDERHPGIPPYEKLDRIVYVVTYTLAKDGRAMTCTLTRDQMFDTASETCEPAR